jgi:hypothetical protein
MLAEIYVEVDDFCKKHEQIINAWLKESGLLKKNSPAQLSLSEVMTILIYYHHCFYKDFKHYYTRYVCTDLRRDFPQLVSYNRFIELVPRALLPLCMFLKYRCQQSRRTGIYYIDSSAWAVCHPKRAHSHKVMRGLASWGKTSVGWFYGLKYHLITNQLGELMNFSITQGSTADNKAKVLFTLTKNLMGWLFGDKGYLLSEEKREFLERDGLLKIFSKCRKNMKKDPLPLEASLWIRKRGVIESVIDLTKNTCDAAHTRHRSPFNALINLFSALAAYSFFQRKPTTFINLQARLIGQPNPLAMTA